MAHGRTRALQRRLRDLAYRTWTSGPAESRPISGFIAFHVGDCDVVFLLCLQLSSEPKAVV